MFAPHAGGVRLELAQWQRDLLARLWPMLDEAEVALPRSPYPDHPEADAEYRRLMAGEWTTARSSDRSIVETTLETAAEGTVLTTAEAEAWLRVLGESRLMLAGLIGIDHPGWDADGALEETFELALLHHLSWMQASLVEVMSEALPDPG